MAISTEAGRNGRRGNNLIPQLIYFYLKHAKINYTIIKTIYFISKVIAMKNNIAVYLSILLLCASPAHAEDKEFNPNKFNPYEYGYSQHPGESKEELKIRAAREIMNRQEMEKRQKANSRGGIVNGEKERIYDTVWKFGTLAIAFVVGLFFWNHLENAHNNKDESNDTKKGDTQNTDKPSENNSSASSESPKE